jgi:SAM-dependent methyltransferase
MSDLIPNLDMHEVRVPLPNLAAWREFVDANPWCHNSNFIEALAGHASKHGVYSHFSRVTKPAVVEGKNYRETIVTDGLNSRTRGILDEVFAELGDDLSRRVLMLEAITPFALAVRGRYPFALGTEYLPTQQDKGRFFPVHHLDLLDPGLPHGVFDVVVSNDVLEHVPNLPRAMQETRRLLKPGGICLASFPFAYNTYETSIRAVFAKGKVVHLTEPEFHGNPVDEQGSLVFQVPGWDLLEICLKVGFSTAEMLFVSSAPRGLTGAECAGVFILRAQV